MSRWCSSLLHHTVATEGGWLNPLSAHANSAGTVAGASISLGELALVESGIRGVESSGSDNIDGGGGGDLGHMVLAKDVSFCGVDSGHGQLGAALGALEAGVVPHILANFLGLVIGVDGLAASCTLVRHDDL